MIRCTSPICIVIDNVRGRTFVPRENAEGVAKTWCPECIQISNQLLFFSQKTAQMIRTVYKSYIDTELPKPVKLILEQFAREVIKNLNEEL